ncbi:hypothetical protein C8R47DRAFT_1327252 [Mycena vitilis]|nr:hypothetical protein C8R47DRAFT_1327252 [Mycena vitilis]
MQFKLLVALAVSLLTFAVSAAPIPASGDGLDIVNREIDAPFVGISETARVAKTEPENETEEARACRMYACICTLAPLHPMQPLPWPPRLIAHPV